MTIKEEFAPKDIRNTKPEKKKKSKKDRYKKLEKKIDKIEKENVELKECLNKKSRRISKLESRWDDIKIVSALISMIIFAVFVVAFFYLANTSMPDLLSDAMYGMGCASTVYFICLFLTSLFLYVVCGEDEDKYEIFVISACVSLFIAFMVFFFGAFFSAMWS